MAGNSLASATKVEIPLLLLQVIVLAFNVFWHTHSNYRIVELTDSFTTTILVSCGSGRGGEGGVGVKRLRTD